MLGVDRLSIVGVRRARGGGCQKNGGSPINYMSQSLALSVGGEMSSVTILLFLSKQQ